MTRAAQHFLLLAVWFFGTWFALSRIDFVGMFEIEQFTKENERKFSDLVFRTLRSNHAEIDSDSVVHFLAGIRRRICEPNGIPDSSITLYVIAQNDVNAFALPDRRLVINSGLLTYCDSPEEVAGVIAHEIAHIEHRHVMQKLVKEIGFVMLTTIAKGNAGKGVLNEGVRALSSTAFDREQESQADASAVTYMAKAGIDPEYLAALLLRLSREKSKAPRQLEWLSTHPDASNRAAEIVKLSKRETFKSRSLATESRWKSFQALVARHKRNAM
jgi:predicted Zn-dependent protease